MELSKENSDKKVELPAFVTHARMVLSALSEARGQPLAREKGDPFSGKANGKKCCC